MTIIRCASHLRPVLDPKTRQIVIDDCLKSLAPHKNKFDAIAMSGYSMSLIAPVIADAMNKGLIVVRKSTSGCASQNMVEGCVCDNYIIIDDLVCSQTTIKRVKKTIANNHHPSAKLYGVYLYQIRDSAIHNHPQFEERLGCKLLNSQENVNKQLDA